MALIKCICLATRDQLRAIFGLIPFHVDVQDEPDACSLLVDLEEKNWYKVHAATYVQVRPRHILTVHNPAAQYSVFPPCLRPAPAHLPSGMWDASWEGAGAGFGGWRQPRRLARGSCPPPVLGLRPAWGDHVLITALTEQSRLHQ